MHPGHDIGWTGFREEWTEANRSQLERRNHESFAVAWNRFDSGSALGDSK
jgi:hypothetical protein